MHRTLAGALLAAIFLGAPAAALAQTSTPRVAVGPFVGTRASLAREAVEATLDEHAHEVSEVAGDAWTAAARSVGLGSASGDDDLARAARQAGADAVLVGDLTRRPRGDYVLHVRVVRASDGESLGTASWELANLTEVDSIRGEIWPQIGRYLVASAPASPPPSAPEPAPTPPPSATPAPASAAPVEASAAPPTVASPASTVAPTPGLGLADVSLGIGGAMRYYRLSLYGDVSPRGYDNPGYAEARLDVSALYRWSHDRAGIGVQAWGVYPFALSSFAADDTGQVIALPTSSYEFGVGATAAYRPPGGGSLRVGASFVMHAFNVDTSALSADQQLAPVTYLGGRFAAEGALPLYADADYEFALVFGAEVRLVQLGQELRASFGQQTGLATGVGGGAGLQLRLDGIARGLSVRLAAELLRYRVTFTGRSDIARGNDSTDDYVRFMGVLTYAIGTGAAR